MRMLRTSLAPLLAGLIALSVACSALPSPLGAARVPASREAAVRVRLMRDIRSLGRRMHADLARALRDYDRLPGNLAGVRSGGLSARERSAGRASTDAVGPMHDLIDAARALRAIDAEVRLLARAHAGVAGLGPVAGGLRADLLALERLSVLVGASTGTLGAMAHFARLVEENRLALLMGRRPAPSVLRGMAHWLALARRDASEMNGVSDPFLSALRSYVALGEDGYAKLQAGGMSPLQAVSFESRGRGLKGTLGASLPTFQARVAAGMRRADRAALVLALRVERGSATRLHAHGAVGGQGARKRRARARSGAA